MINKEELIVLHEWLNETFWGTPGIRSEESLDAALARPLATFDQQELYANKLEKAAALAESLVKNHPFQEGNMRTAYVLLRLMLLEEGLDIKATEEERHTLMLDIATSQAGHQDIMDWLGLHAVPTDCLSGSE